MLQAAAVAAVASLLLRAPAARLVEALRLLLLPLAALARPPSVALLLLPIRRLVAAQAEGHSVPQLSRLLHSVAAVAVGLALGRRRLASVVASVNSSRLPEDSASRQQVLASEDLQVAVVASVPQTPCRVEADIPASEDEQVVGAGCQMR